MSAGQPNLDVAVGHGSSPSTGGAATTASTYAGFGHLHLLVVADGAAGPVPSRIAAQAAVSAVTASVRATSGHTVDERLFAAFRDAHRAVRRSAVGSHAEGRAGAAVAALVLTRERVTLARIGGGRAYVVSSDGNISRFAPSVADGYVGDAVSVPELVSRPTHLMTSDRLVLATEATARTIASDLASLCRGDSPQAVAQRLAATARRRGESGALLVQVLEVRSEHVEREAHPAVARLARGHARTYDVEGRRVHGLRERPRHRSGPGRLAVVVALAGALTGGALGWLTSRPGPPAAHTSRGAPDAPTPPPPPPAPVSPTATRPPAEDAGPPLHEEALAEAFREPSSIAGCAKAVRRYLDRTWRQEGQRGLDRAAAWVELNRSKHVIDVLVAVLQGGPPHRIRTWAGEVLSILYED